MSLEHKARMHAGKSWRRHPGAALLAALFVGGSAALFLRSRGGISVEKVGDLPERNLAVSLEGAWEETGGLSARVGQVLRAEADGSTAKDRRLVWGYLRECGEASDPGRGVDWFGVDEALSWLRGASEAGVEIEAELTGLGLDGTLCESLRCFALEHLGMWAELHPLGAATVEQLRAVTDKSLVGGVGAAALRILNRIRSQPSDAEWLRARILGLLERTECHPEQRVAALQIAVELEATEVEPAARKLSEPTWQVAERVNAFLALGRLGNHETLHWLGSQPKPAETLVLEARKQAIVELAKR
jgi:hypothetical protein